MLEWKAVPLITSLLSLIAIIVSFRVYYSQRNFTDAQRAQKLSDRLYEIDKITISNPGIPKKMHELRRIDRPFFYGDTARDEEYFALKSYVYMHISFFDEIILTAHGDSRVEEKVEFSDWKTYIIERMRHPLFKEIFDNEPHIFGRALRGFLGRHRAEFVRQTASEVY